MSEILKGNGSGNVPAIRWGEEFESWDSGKQLAYAKNLASSMNQAADIMQKERNIAVEAGRRMKELLEAAQEDLDIQRKIVLNDLTANNAEKQELFKRIQELERLSREKSKVIDQLQS